MRLKLILLLLVLLLNKISNATDYYWVGGTGLWFDYTDCDIANAGADQTSCGTAFVILAANTVSGGNWIGGTGTFLPNRNTANATYVPAVGEIGSTVTLTWVVPDPDGAGPCTSSSDQMNITVNTPVAANAGADQTTCGTTSVILAANTVSGGNWTGGTGTFLPDRNTANATYVPAPGEVGTTITLTWYVPDPDGAGPCTAIIDQMNIVIELCCIGSVSVGPDATSYFGLISEQCVTKTAVVQNGTEPYTYSWTIDRSLLPEESITNANSATVTVCLLDTAILCVTVTDANGCIFTDCANIFAQDVRCFAGNSSDHKIYVCHNNNTICVDQSTLTSHLNHGDYIGRCISNTLNTGETAGEEIAGSWLKIYPNPSHGNFTLYINSNVNYVDAEIINASGQIIKRVKINGQSKIDLTIKNVGVYFIRLTSADRKILTRKVVVLE